MNKDKTKVSSFTKRDTSLDIENIYQSSIKPYVKLKKEEELEYIIKAQSDNNEALTFLVENYMLYINQIARKYIGRGVEYLDLVQEGTMGFVHSIKVFDTKSGYRLLTYATPWIKQYINRYIHNNQGTVRIPVHAIEIYNKINMFSKQYEIENGLKPTTEMIAKKFHISKEKVAEIQNLPIGTSLVSLDKQVVLEEGDSDNVLIDFISDTGLSIEEKYLENENHEEIINLMKQTLNQKEIKIIEKRFGFYNDKVYTLEEIGNEIGLTRERVRQIESNAIKKIQKKQMILAAKEKRNQLITSEIKF